MDFSVFLRFFLAFFHFTGYFTDKIVKKKRNFMVTECEVMSALQELYKRVGTQSKLAALGGITQSTINAYLSGKAKIENMPTRVFLRLFRDMKIDFFGESADTPDDAIRQELLHIYDRLELTEKARLLALVAAHFGSRRKEKPLK